MEATLLVVLGWLLGVLAGPIGDRIKRRYSASDLQAALLVEIRELRYTMASCVSLFSSRLGILDHDIIAWLEPIERDYNGPDKDPRALEYLLKLKALAPAELAAETAHQKGTLSGMSLKQYSTSFLDSQMPHLGILPMDLQQRLLRLKDDLDIFNQEVAFLNGQFDLTFRGDLGGANYAAVQTNLTNGYANLISRARAIAVAANAIIDKYGARR